MRQPPPNKGLIDRENIFKYVDFSLYNYMHFHCALSRFKIDFFKKLEKLEILLARLI